MLRRQSRPLPNTLPAAPAHRASRAGLLRPSGPRPGGRGDAADRRATRLEACIAHHLEQVRVHAGTGRPGVIDDATARCDPPTRPFSAIRTAPEPRDGSDPTGGRASVRTSPRATAEMPAVTG